MDLPPFPPDSVLKDRYVLHEKIGEGGTAEVYRATHLLLGREVAIKIIKANLSQKSAAQRFIQEARAVAQLNHPNILQVYDFDTLDEHRSFMATEYLPKGDLFSMIERRRIEGRPFTLLDTIAIVKSVALGLHYAHQQGVVHRDLKPSNIFFSKDQRVVVGDFGLAKLIEGTQVTIEENSILGTPAYISPEQILGLPVDARTDIYALGIVFFHLLTGEMPYQGSATEIFAQHLHAPIPDVAARYPGLPSMAVTILRRALAKEPDARYPSMADLIDDLDLLSRQIDTSDRTLIIEMPTPPSNMFAHFTPPPTLVLKKPVPRRVWIGGIALLLVLGALAAGILAGVFRPGSKSPGAAARIKPAAPNEFLVIVPSMVDSGTGLDMTQAIADELKTGVVGITLAGRLRVAVLDDPLTSEEQAAAIGRDTNAALVVWGQPLATGCEAAVQAPRHPATAIQKLSLIALAQEGADQVCLQQAPSLIDYYARFLLLYDLILADDLRSVFYLALSFRNMDETLVSLARTPLDRQVLQIFVNINRREYLESDSTATDLLNIAPGDLGVYFMRCAANALGGQQALTERDALRLAALTPGQEFGSALLTVTYYLYGNETKLIESAQPLLHSTTPTAVFALNQYLPVLIHQGKYAEVSAYLSQPEDPNAVNNYLGVLVFLTEIQGDTDALKSLLPDFLDYRQDRFYQEGNQFFRQLQPRYFHPAAFSQGGYLEEISGQTAMATLTYQLGLSLHPDDYLLLWRQAGMDVAAGNIQRAYERYDAAARHAPVPFPIARYEQARLALNRAADLDDPRPVCDLANEAQALAETDAAFFAALLNRIAALRQQAACPDS